MVIQVKVSKVSDVAKCFGVSEKTIWRLLRDGYLPRVKIYHCTVIPNFAIDDFISRRHRLAPSRVEMGILAAGPRNRRPPITVVIADAVTGRIVRKAREMGIRGPEKVYDVQMRVAITYSQDEFLCAMADLQGVTKQEVLRRMIDTFFPYSLAPSNTVTTREK